MENKYHRKILEAEISRQVSDLKKNLNDKDKFLKKEALKKNSIIEERRDVDGKLQ